jgi:hypothetical protein
LGHDGADALVEVGSGDAGDACEGGFDAEADGFEQAFGVDAGHAAHCDYGLVAGALAFFDQAPLHPPDQGVEPECGFDEHVKGGGEVVAAARVGELMDEDGFDVLVVEALGEALGPDERRAEDAEDSGLHRLAG